MTETELITEGWTCDRCQVTVRWMSGEHRPELPANWVEEDGEAYCLGCRREIAAEQALGPDPEEGTAEDRRKLRSAARIEFELRRDPDGMDARIARACHTSIPAVRKARERLGVAGQRPV
jgi:hypothetical protein